MYANDILVVLLYLYDSPSAICAQETFPDINTFVCIFHFITYLIDVEDLEFLLDFVENLELTEAVLLSSSCSIDRDGCHGSNETKGAAHTHSTGSSSLFFWPWIR